MHCIELLERGCTREGALSWVRMVTEEPLSFGHQGDQYYCPLCGQVAALSRSFCTGLVQLGPAVVTIMEEAALTL